MFSIDDAGDGHSVDRKCTEYTGTLSPASFRKCCFRFFYLDYVLFCRIIIILNMEIVASKEGIAGNPKLLGAGPEHDWDQEMWIFFVTGE
jgi:hypothetical protein